MRRALSVLAIVAASLAGASVMAIEVAGAAVLAPAFGMGLNAWAAMIVVALGGLAIGYAAGGLLADRLPRHCGVMLSVSTAASGVLCIVDAFVWDRVVYALAGLGAQWGALAAGAVLFLVPFILLGSVYPLALRIRTTRLGHVGRRGGGLSAVSAIGSLVGAALAGFVLVPLLAIETVFTGSGAVLLVVAALVAISMRGGRTGGAVLLIAALAAALLPTRPLPAGILERRGSLFGPLEVYQSGITRYLLVARTCQGIGRVDSDGTVYSAMPHVRVIADLLAADIPPNDGEVLLIGLGAGFLPRELAGVRCRSVEIDPAVVEAAERYFSFDRSQHPVHLADGRAFLLTSRQRYEAVVIDAFRGLDIPVHLLTRECFALVRERMTAKGVLVVNFQGFLTGERGRLLRSIERTLRAVFDEVEIVLHEQRDGYGSVIFAAHAAGGPLRWPREPGYVSAETFLDGGAAEILTDSRNPASLWCAQLPIGHPSGLSDRR